MEESTVRVRIKMVQKCDKKIRIKRILLLK